MRQEYGLMRRRSGKGRPIYYYWVYDENGNRIYRSTGLRTKAEALEFVLRKREDGTLLATKRSDMTLAEYTRPFFIRETCPILNNAVKRGKTIAGSTLIGRRNALEHKILPYLGQYPISKLTPNVINNWLLDLPEKTECSRTSANIYMSTLSTILKQAVNDNLIKTNPCDRIELLKNDSERHEAFTLDEIRGILALDLSEWRNPRVRTMCRLAALTGMRIGEVQALQTRNVSKDMVTIENSFSQHDRLKCTKNGRKRYAPITEDLYEELMEFADPDGFVFSLRKDIPISKATIGKALNDVLGKLGISNKTFHSFRAFFNTQLELSNVNETVIRSVVGHKSSDMSEHYLHLEAGDLSIIRNVQKQIMA